MTTDVGWFCWGLLFERHLHSSAGKCKAESKVCKRSQEQPMLGITCLEITNVYSADTTKEAVVQRPCTLHRRDRRRHACIFTVPREIISPSARAWA